MVSANLLNEVKNTDHETDAQTNTKMAIKSKSKSHCNSVQLANICNVALITTSIGHGAEDNEYPHRSRVSQVPPLSVCDSKSLVIDTM